jgi:hypothetical protein
MPYLTTEWGNPSSAYKFGSKLKSVIQTAREQVAELIDAQAMDVIFTSCGTDSNNTAIAAALRANPGKRHIITSQVEHSSVLNYCMALEKQSQDSPQSTLRSQRTARQSASVFSVPSVVNGSSYGYRVTYLPVDREGLLRRHRAGEKPTVRAALTVGYTLAINYFGLKNRHGPLGRIFDEVHHDSQAVHDCFHPVQVFAEQRRVWEGQADLISDIPTFRI